MPLTDLEDRLELGLRDSFDNIEERLREVLAQLEEDRSGAIAASAGNITSLDETIRRLKVEMAELGMKPALEAQRDVLQEMLERIKRNMVGLDISSVFRGATTRAIRMLLTGADEDIVSVAGAASGQVSKFLRSAILGGVKRADLIGDIAKVLKTTKGRAKTTALTSLHSFHRQITVTHSTESGVKEFGYDGPDDNSTREWCKHWVGLKGTIAQFEATSQKWGHIDQPTPVMVWGGGWRCRHGFTPLIGRFKKKYKQGPR